PRPPGRRSIHGPSRASTRRAPRPRRRSVRPRRRPAPYRPRRGGSRARTDGVDGRPPSAAKPERSRRPQPEVDIRGPASYAFLRAMCRNIRVLHHFEPPTTPEEIRAAAVQYVRKVSGMRTPAKAEVAAEMDRAVEA